MSSPPHASSSSRTAAHVDLLGTILCALLALITIGFAAFRFGPVLPVGASRNVDKALFSSVNLTTLTGFTQSFAAVGDYPTSGHWVMTVISVLSAAVLLAGGGTFAAAIFGIRLAFLRTLTYALILLLVCWFAGLIAGPLSAASAATGLGLLTSTSVSPAMQVMLVSLGLPASIGLVLLLTISRRHLPQHRFELLSGAWIGLAVVYLAGVILFSLVGLGVVQSSLLAIDSRSLGSGIVPVTTGGRATQWITAILMIVGAGPASVAGGLSVLPIVVVLRSAWTALRGGVADRLLGVAVVWIVLFFAGLIVLVLGLASTQPQLPGDRMFFLAVSALCNVGLSHDPVSMSREGVYLLSGGMIWGRVLPLLMLCWMACVADRHDDNADRAGS